MELILNAIAFIFLIHAAIIFYNRPANVVALLQIFNIIFFLLPAINIYYSGEVFSISHIYGIIKFDYKFFHILYFYIFILATAIVLGVSKTRRISNPIYYSSNKITLLLQFFLITLWLLMIADLFSQYTNSIWNFLLPSRKALLMSGVERVLITSIPLALFTYSVIFNKSKLRVYLYATMIIASSFVLGQRREILSGLIFIFTLPYIYSSNRKIINKEFRKTIAIIGLVILILIPLSWYGRVLSTQLQRSGEILVNPTSLRSPLELVFGSFATGYESFLIFEKYTESGVIHRGDSVKYASSALIPRAIYPSKPMHPTQKIKLSLNHEGNISIFFITELFFNFYYFAIPVLFLILFLLCRLNNFLIDSYLFISIFLLSQVAYIFKNGLFQFLPSAFIYISLAALFIKLSSLKISTLGKKI